MIVLPCAEESMTIG